MGHFIPCVNLGGALHDRGHDVTVIVSKQSEDRTQKVIASSGCKTFVTKDDCTDEDLKPLKGFAGRKWIPFLREAVKSIQPDIAVVDFISPCGAIVADEIGVPVIVNLPGSIKIFNVIGGHLPVSKNISTCCGVICLKQHPVQFFVRKVMKKKVFDPLLEEFMDTFLKRVVIINCFFGFDESTCIPPNLVMTGPLFGKSKQL